MLFHEGVEYFGIAFDSCNPAVSVIQLSILSNFVEKTSFNIGPVAAC